MQPLIDKAIPVSHGFFGRKGGVSTGIYQSLNCGLGTDDNPEAVAENRRRAVFAIAGKDLPLLTLHQQHTNLCFYTADAAHRPVGDALVTDVPGLAIGVLTADCAPVLFYGEKPSGQPVIGAAHAGWRGALSGILENTVKEMAVRGARDITAAIGPCIGCDSYEVGPEFRDKFDAEFFKIFSPVILSAAKDLPGDSSVACGSLGMTEGNVHEILCFNLPAYVAHRLRVAGVENLSLSCPDTYANENDYFSYRRTAHQGEMAYGRQLSVIGIKS